MLQFISTFVLIVAAVQVKAQCDSGAVYDANQDKCFTFHQSTVDFYTAEETCVASNGHLASIHNTIDNNFLSKQAQQMIYADGPVWLGAKAMSSVVSNKKNWMWTDGSVFDYTNYRTGQPSMLDGPACMQFLAGSGKWLTARCNQLWPFICVNGKINESNSTTRMLTTTTLRPSTTPPRSTTTLKLTSTSTPSTTTKPTTTTAHPKLTTTLKPTTSTTHPKLTTTLKPTTTTTHPKLKTTLKPTTSTTHPKLTTKLKPTTTTTHPKPPTTCIPKKIPRCPSRYAWLKETNSCYQNVVSYTTFADASAACQKNGDQLASVHSDVENQFLVEISKTSLNNTRTFIGLQLRNSVWQWTDGSKVDYLNWAGKSPNYKDEQHWATLTDAFDGETSRGKWHVDGWNHRAHVCKRRANF